MPLLTLTENKPDGAHLHRLTFAEALDGHDKPGQFITAHLEGHKPAYFALACSPGDPVVLLVKAHGDAAEALVGLVAGSKVEISDPIGNGFPLERVDGKHLVVLVNGSGISAARSVIQGEVARGLPRPVHLYYGVFTDQHRSFVDDLETWSSAGVKVNVVHDADGYVQDAAKADGLCRADVGVVIVGHKAMAQAAQAMWTDAGCPPEALLTNF